MTNNELTADEEYIERVEFFHKLNMDKERAYNNMTNNELSADEERIERVEFFKKQHLRT